MVLVKISALLCFVHFIFSNVMFSIKGFPTQFLDCSREARAEVNCYLWDNPVNFPSSWETTVFCSVY